MSLNFPCGICKIEVGNNNKAIQCNQFDKWNYINCVEISSQKYAKLKYDPLPWLCAACIKNCHF